MVFLKEFDSNWEKKLDFCILAGNSHNQQFFLGCKVSLLPNNVVERAVKNIQRALDEKWVIFNKILYVRCFESVNDLLHKVVSDKLPYLLEVGHFSIFLHVRVAHKTGSRHNVRVGSRADQMMSHAFVYKNHRNSCIVGVGGLTAQNVWIGRWKNIVLREMEHSRNIVAIDRQ